MSERCGFSTVNEAELLDIIDNNWWQAVRNCFHSVILNISVQSDHRGQHKSTTRFSRRVQVISSTLISHQTIIVQGLLLTLLFQILSRCFIRQIKRMDFIEFRSRLLALCFRPIVFSLGLVNSGSLPYCHALLLVHVILVTLWANKQMNEWISI